MIAEGAEWIFERYITGCCPLFLEMLVAELQRAFKGLKYIAGCASQRAYTSIYKHTSVSNISQDARHKELPTRKRRMHMIKEASHGGKCPQVKKPFLSIE